MVTLGDTVYFLIAILDGYSRNLLSWDLRSSMKTDDVQIVAQQAVEAVQKSPQAALYNENRPRIISDNGKQYKCREFNQFLGIHGLSLVTTSPYYPQSNGKMERCWQTLKGGGLRVSSEMSLEEAKEVFSEYVRYYNEERLHSAIGYITPKDMLEGRQQDIHRVRDQKLEKRRKERAVANRKTNISSLAASINSEAEGEAQATDGISAEGRSEATLCPAEA